jgi:hypothetical protein
MQTMTLPAPTVKPTRPAALDWPESPEVDGSTWELGPTPAEDLDASEPDWDALADESAALDRLCAGCLL